MRYLYFVNCLIFKIWKIIKSDKNKIFLIIQQECNDIYIYRLKIVY